MMSLPELTFNVDVYTSNLVFIFYIALYCNCIWICIALHIFYPASRLQDILNRFIIIQQLDFSKFLKGHAQVV